MAEESNNLHLAVALDGAGWHPAAWREQDARPDELLTASYWSDLVGQAERGLLDFVTIEDGLALQSDDPFSADDRLDRVRGRVDAVLIAARIAPLTTNIGLVPTAIVTHTEPFHVSKAIASLDYVSTGRAGVRVQISGRHDAVAHFGRRDIPRLSVDALDSDAGQQLIAEHFAEAVDYVEVLRRLWDSWEDDAEIRDIATGRFVDKDKLHYINFEGRWFSVKGPSITPRPPQGQPIVAALGHGSTAYPVLAGSADVAFVTPRDAAHARTVVDEIAALRSASDQKHDAVRIFGDLVVFLDDTAPAAQARRDRLDGIAGAQYRSDAEIFVGTPAQLADVVVEWHAAGLSGIRLRPATLPHDLTQITDKLVPELIHRKVFRAGYESNTLRGLLGLGRPANRYATA